MMVVLMVGVGVVEEVYLVRLRLCLLLSRPLRGRRKRLQGRLL